MVLDLIPTSISDKLKCQEFQLQIRENLVRTLSTAVAAGVSIYFVDRLIRLGKLDRLVKELWGGEGHNDSSGDAGLGDNEIYNEMSANKIAPILTLPINLRSKIWFYLNPEELRSLRLVCGRLQCDVDFMVGIRVILDSQSECFKWIQHIAIQSCYVKYLETPLDWSIIAKPKLLKKMELSETIPGTHENIQSVLDYFPCLEELAFYMKPAIDEGDGFHVNQVESLLHAITNESLDGLMVGLVVESWSLKWTANYKRCRAYKESQQDNISRVFCKQLSHIFVCLPSINADHRKFWLEILNRQHNLKTLNLNLGDVDWTVYRNVVVTNAKSLAKIFFSRIGNNLFKESEQGTEKPFDFQIFESCEQLRVLGVCCDSIWATAGEFIIPTKAINVEKVPHENLEGVLFSFIDFETKDLKLITSLGWGWNINRGALINCSVDNIILKKTISLKKAVIDTNTVGYYPLLGTSLKDEDLSCYFEPEIAACYNLAEIGTNTFLNVAETVQEWATPAALLLWLTFC